MIAHGMRLGLLRLWIVCSVILVLGLAELDFQQKVSFWEGQNKAIIHRCVDVEFSNPTHPDALDCGRKQGTYKTVFEREGTTPAAYWPKALFGGLVVDLILTAIIAVMFLVGRWVWDGFRHTPESPAPSAS